MTIPSDSARRLEADVRGVFDRISIGQPITPFESPANAIAVATVVVLMFASGGATTGIRQLVTVLLLAAVAALAAATAALAAAATALVVHVAFIAFVTTFAFRAVFAASVAGGLDAEAASRVAGGIHATFATLIAAAALWSGPTVEYAAATAAWSLGYLAHDLELVAWGALRWRADTGARQPVDWPTVAHHLAFSLAALVAPLAPALAARAWLAEAAVPPLYVGWWLVRTGGDVRHPRAFAVNAAVVLACFIVGRVLNFALLLPAAYAECGLPAAVGGAALLSLNMYWTWRLLLRACASIWPTTPAPDTAPAAPAAAAPAPAAPTAAVRRQRARAD
jgi:hypothetical protein